MNRFGVALNQILVRPPEWREERLKCFSVEEERV
jgi:hypothetical protein